MATKTNDSKNAHITTRELVLSLTEMKQFQKFVLALAIVNAILINTNLHDGFFRGLPCTPARV